MTPIERATRANELLDDAVLKQAFADVREQIVSGLESVAFGDVDSQHHLALSLQVLKNVQVRLRKYAEELAVDKAKDNHLRFIDRIRQSYTP